MTRYEYKVIPAPQKGEKSRKARTTEDRFALALSGVMNKLGQDGWEYLRADTLPCEERVGLTGKTTHFQHMLVFRRTMEAPEAASPSVVAPAPIPAPAPTLAEAAALLPEEEPSALDSLIESQAQKTTPPLLFPGPRPNGRA